MTRAARPALLAEVKAGTLTPADVLGREDDLARRTKVSQVLRAVPGVGPVRAAIIMERVGIPAERRVAGLGSRSARPWPSCPIGHAPTATSWSPSSSSTSGPTPRPAQADRQVTRPPALAAETSPCSLKFRRQHGGFGSSSSAATRLCSLDVPVVSSLTVASCRLVIVLASGWAG